MIIVFYYFKTLLGVCKPGAVHTITRLHDYTLARIHGHTCTDEGTAVPLFFPAYGGKIQAPRSAGGR